MWGIQIDLDEFNKSWRSKNLRNNGDVYGKQIKKLKGVCHEEKWEENKCGLSPEAAKGPRGHAAAQQGD